MTLEELAKAFVTSDPFHPMDHLDWDTWGGCNPGTYISHDSENRILFVEPMGTVTVMMPRDPSWEESVEYDFHVMDTLTGFSDEAVAKNDAYHVEVAQLRANPDV